ncbi:hypothetical protein ACL02S_14890 [Nocardia sp. 004]|uniref:hypothetical protein n=1 Tax=Nocardia sp. 004 TaxID=3385978 RepID=UPI0039A11010
MPDVSNSNAVTANTEIAALAQQVETARGKLPLQLDPALLEVLSEREIAAERELAEWIRAQRRAQRRREIEAELAAEKRDRKSAAALRRRDEADARWHRRAVAARRRVSSADARLAQLYRRAEWSSRALIAVVVLGMAWAGVNVQRNLVPSGDMSDPLYWLSYGIEAMISIPIITIMIVATTAARWGRELPRGKVIFFEVALLGTTVALNTGPHLATGQFGRAAEYAIAPVMVGVVIWLHAWVSARYAMLIDSAPMTHLGSGSSPIEPTPTPKMPDSRYDPQLDADTPAHSTGRGVETRANGHTHDLPAAVGAVPLSADGHPGLATSALDDTFTLPNGKHTAAPMTDGHTWSPSPHGNAAASPGSDSRRTPPPPDRIRDTSAEGRTIPAPERPPAPHSSPHTKSEPTGSPDESTPTPRQSPTHDPHAESATGEGATTATMNSAVPAHPAQRVQDPEPSGPPRDRAQHGSSTIRNGYAENAEPPPVPAAATADLDTQADPNASAPRSAKLGKARPAERKERSTDTESTQLALDEALEPPHPQLRAEPTPLRDTDATESPTKIDNAESRAETDDSDADDTDEADTVDDEIAAIARAITDRRLSNLPIVEVREILTLADQGRTSQAIANELGIPRAAVTRVVDSAIKVHRPYAITG